MNFRIKIKNKIINYSPIFANVNRNLWFIHLAPYLFYSLFIGSAYRANLINSYRINKLKVHDARIINRDKIPNIELIVNSTSKDFLHLNNVINYAISNSVNKVSKISICVPDNELEECKQIISKNEHRNKVQILSEDNVLNLDLRTKIKENFPNRYGWVLQQFLTLDRVLNSSLDGVLQVNSDTIILRPTLWLSDKKVQPLMISTEYYKPYYVLLNRINEKFPILTNTHITHHMLFQPLLLRKILDFSGISNLEYLLELVLKNLDNSAVSPMCIEFELYALGLEVYFPKNFEIVKFGNINFELSKKLNNQQINKKFLKLSRRYNSVSMHSYLQG
jgi:hypothetical protein